MVDVDGKPVQLHLCDISGQVGESPNQPLTLFFLSLSAPVVIVLNLNLLEFQC